MKFTSISDLKKYTTTQFLNDFQKAYNLPRYFEGLPLLEKEFLDQGFITIEEDTRALKDTNTNSFNSLAENFILLASGIPTTSFISLFGVKRQGYTMKDYLNQDPFTATDSSSINLQIYQTLTAFVSLAQQDFDKFAAFGTGLASVLGEMGTIEVPAVEKLNTLLLLAKGGELPEDDNTNEAELALNPYVAVFQKLFGIRWRPIIALHKALTLSKDDLLEVLGFSKNVDAEMSPLLQNIHSWIDLTLLEGCLGLNDLSEQYCKNIIGLINGHAGAFDFVARERDIPVGRAEHIKSLMISRNHHEIQQIFNKMSKDIPENLSSQLRMMINQGLDSGQIINFILKYIDIVRQKSYSWAKIDSFEKTTSKDLVLQTKYLKDLFQLLSGDFSDLEKQYDSILSAYMSRRLSTETHAEKQLLTTFISFSGVFNQDP